MKNDQIFKCNTSNFEFCDYDSQTCLKQKDKFSLEIPQALYPGEQCFYHNHTCKYGLKQCIANRCVGVPPNHTCSSDWDCYNGYVCKGKCVKSNAEICTKSLECGDHKRCLNGTCTELMSVGDGEWIYASDELDLLLCESKTGILSSAGYGYQVSSGKGFISGEYVCGQVKSTYLGFDC